MKIILLIDDYLPSTKSAPMMIHDLGQAFLRRGDTVTIITPSHHILSSSMTMEDGMEVIRFRSGKLKNIGFLRRAINELTLPFFLLLHWIFDPKIRKPDLIISYSPTIFWGSAIAIIKKITHAKNFLILRDIFPQWAVDSGIIRKYSPITLFFRIYEIINYAAADKIAVQSPGCCQYFQNSVFKKKIKVLYNWVYPLKNYPPPNDFRQKYHWEDKVIFFYGGNIGLAQDMDNLMRLAHAMKEYPQARFLIIGKGDAEELIKRRMKEWELTNTLLLPAVSQQEYMQVLMQCDIGMITLHPNHRTQNIPGKLLGYLNLGKPILASVNSGNDLLTMIPEYHAGFASINPNDGLLQKNAIALLDKDSREKMKSGVHHLLKEKFDVNTAVDKIIS